MTVVIARVLPSILDANGDAENVRVLSHRAHCSGYSVRVTDDIEQPDIVVIGSPFDSSLYDARRALHARHAALANLLLANVPVLAVAAGLELLGESIAWGAEELPALGLVPARAVRMPERVVAEARVESPFGTVSGFLNTGRRLELDEGVAALGTVSTPAGRMDRDGILFSSLIGTHLHGPVLALNPSLADTMLARAVPFGYQPGPRLAQTDEWALRATEARGRRR